MPHANQPLLWKAMAILYRSLALYDISLTLYQSKIALYDSSLTIYLTKKQYMIHDYINRKFQYMIRSHHYINPK